MDHSPVIWFRQNGCQRQLALARYRPVLWMIVVCAVSATCSLFSSGPDAQDLLVAALSNSSGEPRLALINTLDGGSVVAETPTVPRQIHRAAAHDTRSGAIYWVYGGIGSGGRWSWTVVRLSRDLRQGLVSPDTSSLKATELPYMMPHATIPSALTADGTLLILPAQTLTQVTGAPVERGLLLIRTADFAAIGFVRGWFSSWLSAEDSGAVVWAVGVRDTVSGPRTFAFRIDAASSRVVDSLEVSTDAIAAAFLGRGMLAVFSAGAVQALDVQTRTVLWTTSLPFSGPFLVDAVGLRLFVADESTGELLQMDSRSGEVRGRTPVLASLGGGLVVYALSFDNRGRVAVSVGEPPWNVGAPGTVVLVDPERAAVARIVRLPATGVAF